MTTRNLCALLGSFALLVGCGNSGSATVHLYDAPPAGVTAVKLFIKSIDAHVAEMTKTESEGTQDKGIDDDGKWETLQVGRSIDLMQHQGESAADVLGQLDLPEGKITQIRLVIDTAQPNTATVSGRDCALDTGRVDAKGIKINHVFKAFAVEGSADNDIFVHFDLDNSLSPKGDCFELNPKIELKKVVLKGKAAAL